MCFTARDFPEFADKLSLIKKEQPTVFKPSAVLFEYNFFIPRPLGLGI